MAKSPEYDTQNGKQHPFHLVDPSIWPMLTSFAAGLTAVGGVMYMHDVEWNGFNIGVKGLIAGFVLLLLCMFMWWKDVINESIVQKAHTAIAKIGMRYGMMLFIISEVMFFVAFFWAFFSASLFPVDGIWPPEGIHTIPAFDLPLMMTMILLLSGCAVTWAHHAVLEGKQKELQQGLAVSVFLGIIFLCFQVYEYGHATFGITDGIYGSTFYMATGFHGFHVLVGTIFLAVCYFRSLKGHFTKKSHFGFEAAAWYWHFVDVVWLFLYVSVYWWGGGDAGAVAH